MAEDVLVHHGASITASGLGEVDEAFLAALVRGEFRVDDDEDAGPHLILRARLMHAFPMDTEAFELGRQVLGLFGVEPDDEATRAMVDGWLDELYGAPSLSASAVGGPMQRWPGLSSASTC